MGENYLNIMNLIGVKKENIGGVVGEVNVRNVDGEQFETHRYRHRNLE